MKKLIGLIYLIVLIVIIFCIFSNLNYIHKANTNDKELKAALNKIEDSLSYKFDEKKDSGNLKWPESITKFVKIDGYSLKKIDNPIKKYSDIFNCDINGICNRIANISKIEKDNNYKLFASQTLVLLNNYKASPRKKEKTFNGYTINGIHNISYLTADLFCASCYYASKNDSKTALLLAYLPIMVIYELEAKYTESNDPYIKMYLMEARNTACINMLFLANNLSSVDKETAVKISNSLLELVKSEPSLISYVNFTKSRINYEFSKEQNKDAEYFIDNICNSDIWKNNISYIYDGVCEEIKKIESGKDPYSLYAWQENVHKILFEGINFSGKDIYYQNINWQKNYTMYVISNYPETFFVDYYDLYQKREEYLAIAEGTATALALSIYSSDKDEENTNINDIMPKNANELSKELNIKLPLDRMSKTAYQFYFADDYFLAGSPAKQPLEKSYFKNYLPYLRNKWVFNSTTTINGIPFELVDIIYSKEENHKFKDLEKLYNMQRQLNERNKK